MWTAKIISVLKSAGRIAVRVAYSNGAETFEEEFSATSKVDMSWLQAQIRTRIDAFSASYAFADTLSVDQQISLTAPAQTQAEIDQQTWLTDFSRLQRAQKLVDLGIIAANNPKFTALKNKVTTGLKAEYVDIL